MASRLTERQLEKAFVAYKQCAGECLNCWIRRNVTTRGLRETIEPWTETANPQACCALVHQEFDARFGDS